MRRAEEDDGADGRGPRGRERGRDGPLGWARVEGRWGSRPAWPQGRRREGEERWVSAQERGGIYLFLIWILGFGFEYLEKRFEWNFGGNFRRIF